MRRSSFLVIAAAGLLGAMGVTAYADDAGTSATDAQITVHVRDKLATNDAQVAQRIQVDTKDGVVTLSGQALTGALMLQALQDAKSVVGVVKVRNHMHYMS